jgi:hypothetical protein
MAALLAASALGLAACAGNGAATPFEDGTASGTSRPVAAAAGADITGRYPAYRFVPPFLRPQDQ